MVPPMFTVNGVMPLTAEAMRTFAEEKAFWNSLSNFTETFTLAKVQETLAKVGSPAVIVAVVLP